MVEQSDKKYLKWIAIVFAIVAAAMVVGIFVYNNFIYDASANPLDPEASSWEGNTYTNKVLGISFALPEGWSVIDPEETKAAAAEIAGQEVDDLVLLSVGDFATGTSLNMTATYGTRTENMMQETAKQVGEDFAKYYGTEYSVEKQENIVLVGKDWEVYAINYPGLNAIEYMMCAQTGEYVTAIALIGVKTENVLETLDCFFVADT